MKLYHCFDTISALGQVLQAGFVPQMLATLDKTNHNSPQVDCYRPLYDCGPLTLRSIEQRAFLATDKQVEKPTLMVKSLSTRRLGDLRSL